MKDENFQTPFSMALMTCVFVGFITSIICLIFNIVFRESTEFPFNDMINVSSLIFSVNLLFVILGLIYSVFVIKSGKSEFIFVGIFLLLVIFAIIKTQSIVRSPDPVITRQFRSLFTGILIIIGLGIVSIPFLFHNRKFKEAVL